MKKHHLGTALLAGLATLAATGVATAQTSVGQVVINEAMIPGVGTDSHEFVELYGPGGHDLSDLELIFVNGGTSGTPTYDTIDLAGQTIPLDGYFVIAGHTTNVPNTDLVDGPTTNWLQNGDPDAIVLRLKVGLTTIDALGYFNQYNLGAVVPGASPLPLVAGTHYLGSPTGLGGDDAWPTQTGITARVAPPAVFGANTNASIGRLPDGNNTSDNYSDFHVLFTGTPGTSNTATPTLSLPISEDFSQATGLGQVWAPSFSGMILETAAGTGFANSPDSVTPGEWVSVKDPTGGGEGSGIIGIGSDYHVTSYVYNANATSISEFAGVVARLNILQNNVGFNFDQDSNADGDFGSNYGDFYYCINLNMTANTAQAQKVDKGMRTNLGSAVAISNNTWTKFEIICDGDVVTFEIDDTQVHQLTGEPVRKGYVALGYYESDGATTLGSVRAHFDGLSIAAPVSSVSDWTMLEM